MQASLPMRASPPARVPSRPASGVGGFLARIFRRPLPAPELPGAAARPSPRGGAGQQISAGNLEDTDHNAEVRGSRWYGEPGRIGIASKMVRDPHVRRSLDAVTAPILAAQWDFEPASKDPLDVEIADFCRWVFVEQNDWRRANRDALRYHRDGFSLLEVTDDVRPIPVERFPSHPGRGRGIIYTGFHYRPASTLAGWVQSKDDPTRIDGIEQRIIGSDGEEAGVRYIPADRLIRFTQEQEGANFAGLATARSAYGAWKTKITMMILLSIRHERMGVGVPCIILPEQEPLEADIRKAETILSEMRAHEKGYLLLPHGYVFSWESSSGGDTGIQATIEACNRDIAFNTGTGFLFMGTAEGAHGSYALAQSQTGPYEISLDQHASFLANTWTLGSDGWSPVKRLVALNYGTDRSLPTMVARNMPTKDWARVLPVVNNLAMTRLITPDEVTEKAIRTALSLPQRDPSTERTLPSIAPVQGPGGGPQLKEAV